MLRLLVLLVIVRKAVGVISSSRLQSMVEALVTVRSAHVLLTYYRGVLCSRGSLAFCSSNRSILC